MEAPDALTQPPLGLSWPSLLQSAHVFMATGDGRLAENVATLLVVGGLLMLSIIFVLVVLGNTFLPPSPSATRELPQDALASVLRPTPPTMNDRARSPAADLPRHHRPGRLAITDEEVQRRVTSLENVMDELAAAGRGEPRILDLRPGYAYVRVLGCASAAAPTPEPDAPPQAVRPVCNDVRDLLQGLAQRHLGQRAEVREAQCDHGYQTACDFEVVG